MYDKKYTIESSTLENTANAIRNKLNIYPSFIINYPDKISRKDMQKIINTSPKVNDDVEESKYILCLDINDEKYYILGITMTFGFDGERVVFGNLSLDNFNKLNIVLSYVIPNDDEGNPTSEDFIIDLDSSTIPDNPNDLVNNSNFEIVSSSFNDVIPDTFVKKLDESELITPNEFSEKIHAIVGNGIITKSITKISGGRPTNHVFVNYIKYVDEITIDYTNTSLNVIPQALFQNFENLERVNKINIIYDENIELNKGQKSLNYLFGGCTSLKYGPTISNTHIFTTLINLFYQCTSLEYIPFYNFPNVSNTRGCYDGITKSQLNPDTLQESIDNILHTLSTITLETTKTLVNTGITTANGWSETDFTSSQYYQDFINAGWTMGF